MIFTSMGRQPSIAPHRPIRRIDPPVATLVTGILAGDRVTLARAITLVESRAERHFVAAQAVLQGVLHATGRSIRLGLTGSPGAGKSTLIEALGMRLCESGQRVAVLAVDPTSPRSGGSILGDKTRMETLARHPGAFIRPSPAGSTLGGVASKTREALLLCEAAGYDVVIVETVGVGQSETAVRDLTDFFLLLQIAGGGDDLQGIKKGVIEITDAIAVTKADGDNLRRAERAAGEFRRVLSYLQPYTPGWSPTALTCSAVTGDGIDALWELVQHFQATLQATGAWEARRREQNRAWFRSLLREAVWEQFCASRLRQIQEMENSVASGALPVAQAIRQALDQGEHRG